MRMLFIPLVLGVSLLNAGCETKPASFKELSEITSMTDSKPENRTAAWYAEQDLVRQKVVTSCMDYLYQKALDKGGAYQNEFNDDAFSKFDEFPDCANARKGDIMKMSKGALVFEHQIYNAEELLNTAESQQHIDDMAKDIAQKFEQLEADNEKSNEVGKQQLQAFDESYQ